MAIDFSGYAQNYASGVPTRNLQAGVSDLMKAIGTRKSRLADKRAEETFQKNKKSEAFAKWRKQYLSNLYTQGMGEGTIQSVEGLKKKAQGFDWNDQSSAWKTFLESAKNAQVDGETYDFSKDLNAMTFAADYNTMHKMISNQWLNSMSALELDPNVSSRTLRNIMKDNPNFFSYLSTMQTDQFRPGGLYEGYVPKETWSEWLSSDWNIGQTINESSTGAFATGAAVTGVGTIWLAPKLYNKLKGLVGVKTAEEVVKAGKDNPVVRDSILKRLRGKIPSMPSMPSFGGGPRNIPNLPIDVTANPQQGNLFPTSRAGKIASDMGKALKDPMRLPVGGVNPGNIARAGALIGMPYLAGKTVEKLTGDENLGQITQKAGYAGATGIALKPVISGISQIVKKHGVAKVLRKVVEKGGVKLALSTLGKLAGGAVGTATGGALTLLMAGWAVKDIMQIAKILYDEFGGGAEASLSPLKNEINALGKDQDMMSQFSPELKAAYKNIT
tara:strand:- start:2288 stop:3787 length:1500 start_codon:yes stop_codon:yes gene_type:complete